MSVQLEAGEVIETSIEVKYIKYVTSFGEVKVEDNLKILLNAVKNAKKQVKCYGSILGEMESKLGSWIEMIEGEAYSVTGNDEIKKLWEQINAGDKLVKKCASETCLCRCFKKSRRKNQLSELLSSVEEFCKQVVRPQANESRPDAPEATVHEQQGQVVSGQGEFSRDPAGKPEDSVETSPEQFDQPDSNPYRPLMEAKDDSEKAKHKESDEPTIPSNRKGKATSLDQSTASATPVVSKRKDDSEGVRVKDTGWMQNDEEKRDNKHFKEMEVQNQKDKRKEIEPPEQQDTYIDVQVKKDKSSNEMKKDKRVEPSNPTENMISSLKSTDVSTVPSPMPQPSNAKDTNGELKGIRKKLQRSKRIDNTSWLPSESLDPGPNGQR